LQNQTQNRLKSNVVVSVTEGGGYCVGLTLQYETGGSNGQHLQNLIGDSPHTLTLLGQPNGNENWTTGSHVLEVFDGSGSLLASTTLTVTS
jgi:hypothetical protein